MKDMWARVHEKKLHARREEEEKRNEEKRCWDGSVGVAFKRPTKTLESDGIGEVEDEQGYVFYTASFTFWLSNTNIYL